MEHRLRRSWLLTPASSPEKLAAAIKSAADVAVLDLVEFVVERCKPAAREQMSAAVRVVEAAGKEAYAQVDAQLLYADLHASVWPGLAGVVISRAETTEQIKEADQVLTHLEAERGLLPGTVRIVVACETARGNHAAYELATASRRVWGLTLGRADLIMELRPEPSTEIHMMQYLMQRLITIAGAVGATPLGAWWRAPDRGLLATPDNTLQAARRGRAIGFRGALCVREDQVSSLNQGFTPSPDEEHAATRLLAAYDTATIAGNAVLRQDDRLFDRGTARCARSLLDLAAACKPPLAMSS